MFSLVLTKIKTSTNISEKKLVKSHPKIYAVSFYPSVNSARSSSVIPPSPRLCNEYPSQVIYCGKDGLFYKTYPNTVDSPYKKLQLRTFLIHNPVSWVQLNLELIRQNLHLWIQKPSSAMRKPTVICSSIKL